MADQKIILSVDDDWKRQAQEEKKRLAEQEQQQAAASATPPAEPAEPATPTGRRKAAPGEAPAASFATIAQSMLTQTLYFLGDLAGRGGQPMMNLDMARYQIDQLTILEEKTKGNLTAEERQFLDSALYEARNRFVAVASQMIGP
jgi:hypothetical protein